MTISFGDLYCYIGEYFVRAKKAEEYNEQLRNQLALANEEKRVLKKFIAEKGLDKEYEDSEYYMNNVDPEFY